MSIHYHCRHCRVKIGTLDQSLVETERLGLHTLNDEERQEMVTYDQTVIFKLRRFAKIVRNHF